MLGTNNEKELFLEDRVKFERLRGAEFKHNGPSAPIFHHPVNIPMAISRLNAEFAIRAVPFERDQDGRSNVLTGGGTDSDA